MDGGGCGKAEVNRDTNQSKNCCQTHTFQNPAAIPVNSPGELQGEEQNSQQHDVADDHVKPPRNGQEPHRIIVTVKRLDRVSQEESTTQQQFFAACPAPKGQQDDTQNGDERVDGELGPHGNEGRQVVRMIDKTKDAGLANLEARATEAGGKPHAWMEPNAVGNLDV